MRAAQYSGVSWRREALDLVRKNATRDKPLAKEELWDVCLASEDYTIPTKRSMSDCLNWLRKNNYINVGKTGMPAGVCMMRLQQVVCVHAAAQRRLPFSAHTRAFRHSADLGTRKYPRYGYCPKPEAPERITVATPDVISKWAMYCHRQPEGHKRAILVSDQASSLAGLMMDYEGQKRRLQETDESASSPWRKPETSVTVAGTRESGSEAEQVRLRLVKALQHETFALQLAQLEGKHAHDCKSLLNTMALEAGKKLSRFHDKDYWTQVCMHARTTPTRSTRGCSAAHHAIARPMRSH